MFSTNWALRADNETIIAVSFLLIWILACFMYLREATKSTEEGGLRHWRHLVIINRHLHAMGGLHLFDFPFWGDGTIADAIGFYLSWIRKVVSYHATKLGFDALRGKDWWLVSSKADLPE